MTYIAPENSPIHNLYDVDIFKSIEDNISFFQQYGKVFLLGDLNSGTSIKLDYTENDRLLNTHDFQTEADTPTPRYSMDRGTNQFGDSLLDRHAHSKWSFVQRSVDRTHDVLYP